MRGLRFRAVTEPCTSERSTSFGEPMAKLILLSIIISSIWLPARAAKLKNPEQGLRKLIIYVLVFNLVYVMALRFLYMRFV